MIGKPPWGDLNNAAGAPTIGGRSSTFADGTEPAAKHRCDDEGVKRLVVCFDGTWNGRRRPGRASNVEHAASCLARSEREGTEQVVWYQPGVGTNYGVDRAIGGLFGFGISSAILSGYRFLSLNYAPGDEVSLLGFSRGAYAARSLANLIANPGLLWPEHLFNEIERFWEAYGTRSEKVMSVSRPTVGSAARTGDSG